MVNTNGVLLAPTNFWTTNASNITAAMGLVPPVTNLASATDNGLFPSNYFNALTSSNMIPPDAHYSATQDPNASDSIGDTTYFYWTNLNPAVTYAIIVPGQGYPANDLGIVSSTNDFADFIYTNGLFTPLHATCEILGRTANSDIHFQIKPVMTNYWAYGLWQGIFDGTLTTNSVVPDSCLGGDVLLRYNQLNGPLYCTTTNSNEHYIAQHGSSDGSLMWLMKADNHGYCDLAFLTKNSTTIPPLAGLDLNSTLRFTFGAGVPGTNQFPYNTPYCEMYLDREPFYFVGASHIWGGFKPATNSLGHWIWYGTDTNDVMMDVNPDVGATLFGHPISVSSNIAAATLAVTNSITIGAAAQILSGTGSPNSVVTAPVGSLFFRTDGGSGTTFYVKESGSGNTGWVGK